RLERWTTVEREPRVVGIDRRVAVAVQILQVLADCRLRRCLDPNRVRGIVWITAPRLVDLVDTERHRKRFANVLNLPSISPGMLEPSNPTIPSRRAWDARHEKRSVLSRDSVVEPCRAPYARRRRPVASVSIAPRPRTLVLVLPRPSLLVLVDQPF